LNRIYHN